MKQKNEITPLMIEIAIQESTSLFLNSKQNKQRIADIRNKIEWKTATFAEKNILMIYEKRMKKARKKLLQPKK